MPSFNVRDIADQAREAGLNGRGLFALMAAQVGIPYLEERETERLLKTRHEGKWVQLKEGVRSWDNGKDFAREFYPESCNSIEDAFQKVGRIKAVWFHVRTLNLVLEDEEGQRIGIRAMEWQIPLFGIKGDRLQAIMDGFIANQIAQRSS